MQATTYISLLALGVSVISLVTSMRNGGFAQRCKLNELKLAMLTKLSATSVRNDRIIRLKNEFLQISKDNNHTALAAMLEMPELIENRRLIENTYNAIMQMPSRTTIDTYESEYHRINKVYDSIVDIEDRIAELKAEYERNFTNAD